MLIVRRTGSVVPILVAAGGLLLAIVLVPLVTEIFDLNPASSQQRRDSIAQGLKFVGSAPLYGLRLGAGRP